MGFLGSFKVFPFKTKISLTLLPPLESNFTVIISKLSVTQVAFNLESLVTTYSLETLLPSSSTQPSKTKPSFIVERRLIISSLLALTLAIGLPPSESKVIV